MVVYKVTCILVLDHNHSPTQLISISTKWWHYWKILRIHSIMHTVNVKTKLYHHFTVATISIIMNLLLLELKLIVRWVWDFNCLMFKNTYLHSRELHHCGECRLPEIRLKIKITLTTHRQHRKNTNKNLYISMYKILTVVWVRTRIRPLIVSGCDERNNSPVNHRIKSELSS